MEAYLQKLQNKENLTQEEIQNLMHQIMSGEAKEESVAKFLLALNEKGPSVEEITGAAHIMRKFFVNVAAKHEVVLDT